MKFKNGKARIIARKEDYESKQYTSGKITSKVSFQNFILYDATL